MKLVVVALLSIGMLCSSTLAIAEDPVPFKELMQAPGAQPSGPPVPDAKSQAQIASQLGRTGHMTTKGKVMTAVGIGMVVIGGTALAGTALWHGPVTPSDKAKLYGAGAGVIAGGTILIVLGAHQRSRQ